MLTIQSFTFNPFQENTYLVINEQKECLIVDPGMLEHHENQKIVAFIEQNKLVPKKIINTHAHIDHILGVDYLKQKFNLEFGLHQLELPVLSGAMGSAAIFGFNFSAVPKVDFYISEKESIVFGDDELELRFVPGHSPGSILFYSKANKFAISGDALFQGSIGRTDLPGGDSDTLISSIQTQIYALPDDTIIYSGHGPSTTVGTEKRNNPFVRG